MSGTILRSQDLESLRSAYDAVLDAQAAGGVVRTKTVNIKVSEQERDLFWLVCRLRGESMSHMVRGMIRQRAESHLEVE